MGRVLLKPLWVFLALLFVAEAWLWGRLAPIVARVVGWLTLPALKRRVAVWIEHLPPYPTLLVFLVPIVLLFPIKLLGFWMLAHGSWFGAMAVLALAKVMSMGVTAFIFEVTRPKLMQLGWFQWAYGKITAGLAWAHRQVDPIKQRVRAWARARLAPALRRVRSLFWLLRPQRSARFLRRLMRIRRRMQQA